MNKDKHYILKVLLKRETNGYKFICYIVDLFNRVIFERSFFSLIGTKEELISLLKEILNEDSNITVMILGIPGVCYDGYIDVCDFKQFENLDLKKYIQDFYHHQFILENDVNIACVDFPHHYPNYQNMVLVYQPIVEYIGCGIIINGQLYNGITHFQEN